MDEEEIMRTWKEAVESGETEVNILELEEGETIEIRLKNGGCKMVGPGYFFGDFLPKEAFG